MKLEVGMYVRTKDGIHKIFNIDNKKTVWKYECDKKRQENGTVVILTLG